MLEKVAQSRAQLLDIMDAVEMLGFCYTITAEAQNGAMTYNVAITGEQQQEAEPVKAGGRYKLPRTMHRRSAEQVAAENTAISEFLRGRNGRLTTQRQIHEFLLLKGFPTKAGSVGHKTRMAMSSDPCIIDHRNGEFSYKS